MHAAIRTLRFAAEAVAAAVVFAIIGLIFLVIA